MNWAGTELQHFRDHHSEGRIFNHRVILSGLLVIILLSILVARFYTLQIVHHRDYATLSDQNRIHVRPIPPNRGLIFDRSGNLLAENRPSYTLSLVKERTRKLITTIEQISEIIRVEEKDKDNFYKLLRQRRRPFEPVPLRYRLSEKEIAMLAVDEFAFEGMEIEAELVRYYPYGNLFAHSVGYVGRINANEINGFDEETYRRYRGTHSIGKIGLEKYYEDILLGTVGHENIETNAHGRVLRVLEQNEPNPGSDLHLFLRADLQAVAIKALKGRRGSVVAIEVDTGGVLAMVSSPSYEPNLFVTGISHKDYRLLNGSKDLPLFNRSIQGQYPPGSTLKPVLGLGGLETGVVNFQTRIKDPGFYQLENDERLYRDWKKEGHGLVDLRKAIAESCDTFFYDMAFRMGIDRLHASGVPFGLGRKTGIDIPSERSGLWPSREWKRNARGLHWFPGDSLNVSIGQGDVLATPLQLAVMTAALATRGTWLGPRLVERIGDTPTELRLLGTYEGNEVHWDYIHSSMEDVLHGERGTARKVGLGSKYRIAGKSGTAQVVGIAQDEEYDSEALDERNRDHALFIAFAPVKEPKIAVAVIVENAESGSGEAAPVVKKVLDAYMDTQ